MNKIIAALLVFACVGCASSPIMGMSTSTTQSYQEETIDPVDYSSLCDELPAHITRSQFGNRPIVVDGVEVVCF